ncbi:MAG TPA: hypothetical protein VFE98_08580 [Candidatus Bathyarchaeia archaeon]|nr:hypothetical protein [Candidatus Bathyarchaeia archaeon]
MNSELTHLERFSTHLRKEDREIFRDMIRQCQLYASHASDMASTVKEIPLLMSIIFGQHKMILKLRRRLDEANGSQHTSKSEVALGGDSTATVAFSERPGSQAP